MLEKAIALMIGLGAKNREQALVEIDKSISLSSMWCFARDFNLLDEERSCTDFAIEFMTAYNNEIEYKY